MAWVQGPVAVNATTATNAATFSGSTPAGNLVVAVVAQIFGGNPPRSITNVRDNVDSGVDYTLAHSQVVANHRIDVYYKIASGAGTRTVTVTFSGGSADSAIAINEYDSAHTTLGPTNGADGTSTTTNPGAASPTGTALYISVITDEGGPTITPDGAFTQRQEIETSSTCPINVHDVISSGSLNPTGTLGSSTGWGAVIVTFESAAVSPSLDGTGAQLTLAGGEGSLSRSLISGDFFGGKFFGGGFFTAAAGGVTLAGTGGALTLTGGTATLRKDRILVGTGGAIALTGGTATLRKDFRLTATGGTLTLAGGTATLRADRILVGAGGALTLTGGDATPTVGGNKTLAGTGGTLTLAGGSASLAAARILVGSGGAIALTGGSATLRADRILLGAGVALALTGGDATMQAGGNVSLDGTGGSLALTGGEATFSTSGGSVASGPTPAGGIISGKRRKRVVIGDDVYDVDSLRDVEFLLKRVVRTEAPPKPKKRRTKVVDRVDAKVTPEAVVEASVPSIAVNWAPLWRPLAAQDQEYANALVKALERQEEDDIETLLLMA